MLRSGVDDGQVIRNSVNTIIYFRGSPAASYTYSQPEWTCRSTWSSKKRRLFVRGIVRSIIGLSPYFNDLYAVLNNIKTLRMIITVQLVSKAWFTYSCNCFNSVGDCRQSTLTTITTITSRIYSCSCCNSNRQCPLVRRPSRFNSRRFVSQLRMRVRGNYCLQLLPLAFSIVGLNVLYKNVTWRCHN